MKWFRKMWRGPKLQWRDMKTDPAPRDGSMCLFFEREPNGPGTGHYFTVASWGETWNTLRTQKYKTWLREGESDAQVFWIEAGCEGGDGASHWVLLAPPQKSTDEPITADPGTPAVRPDQTGDDR